MSKLDPDFMSEVANTPRGRGILFCIQCGRCSSSCPIARLITEHNPRRLMEMAILGFRSEILLHDLPWYCLSCFTCLDRCPQGGDVGEVMFAIRNLAVKEGNVPAGISSQARSLLDTGQVVNPVRTIVRQRERRGLSKVAPPIEDVHKILKRTALRKKMGLS